MIDHPLFNAIKEYCELEPARFHMPGHKGFLSEYDVTELADTDNLACPRYAIAELERLCAKAFGARDSILCVNGSTGCNLAMLLALGVGKKVLLGRNCHKSAVSGLALAGHTAYSLFPDSDGVYSADSVSAALDKSPCDAVFLTSPTYRGYVSDIAAIAKAAHEHGALLLLDCAHGAHFAFARELPPVPAGADMWSVSCHKTLCAFTQSAVLNLGESCPFTSEQVRSRMLLAESSSPSYLLMLSVENSINAAHDWSRHVEFIVDFRKKLEKINGVKLLSSPSASAEDATRLNISVSGVNGYDLAEALEASRIYVEMCDSQCVTLITAPPDPSEWYDMLLDAVEAIAKEAAKHGRVTEPPSEYRHDCGELCGTDEPYGIDVRSAVLGEQELTELEFASGQVAAGAVGIYPPGTAVFFPGERISAKACEFLLAEKKKGAELFGLIDGKVPVLAPEGGING